MIYDKLPVVFLSVMASEKKGTTNYVIASYILDHPDRVKDLGIRELAELCHVGTGSVSRFCREIGLRDFVELKELLHATGGSFDPGFQGGSTAGRITNYRDKVTQSIDLTAASLSRQKLTALCRDLNTYKKTAAFGLLKAETAAISLQSDLWLMGKQIDTSVSYDQQLSYIRQSGRDCLILIFSYTGSYFDYQKENIFHPGEKNNLPRIWMIAGTSRPFPAYVSDVLEFQSPLDQASHPYQLLYIAGLIARGYAALSGF